MPMNEPLKLRGRELVPGADPFIFGILNVTPDSFSDGGLYPTPADAVAAGCRMADEGADAIDVGAESTRPRSRPVSADEQIRRCEPVITGLVKRFGKNGPTVSIDTRSARVAQAALDAGAGIVNDVSALRDDPDLAGLIAERGAGVILMHMKGTPTDMQDDPQYDNAVDEIKDFLAQRIDYARKAGIPDRRIIVDPGIGFAKTTAHNLQILGHLDAFRRLGVPLMVGPSRKRFIGEILDIEDTGQRAFGTAAVVSACVIAGVECVRVHDLEICRQAAQVCAAIRSGAKS